MPVAHASADGFTALAPIPGLTSQSMIINSDSLAAFFNNLYKYLVGLAATIAVIQIMWAGADIAFFHKDAVSAITDDKGKIYNAIFGLVLVLSPALVFSIINPSILNLSLNMPPIKNNYSSSGVSGATGNQQSSSSNTAPSSESGSVQQSVSGTLFQKATFSGGSVTDRNVAAQDWIAACTDSGGVGFLLQSSSETVSSTAGGTGQATPAAATCSNYDTQTSSFLDENTNISPNYKLLPTDNEYSSFASQCSSDGGVVCVENPGQLAKVSCPAATNYQTQTTLFGLLSNSNPNCYEVKLFCAPNGVQYGEPLTCGNGKVTFTSS